MCVTAPPARSLKGKQKKKPPASTVGSSARTGRPGTLSDGIVCGSMHDNEFVPPREATLLPRRRHHLMPLAIYREHLYSPLRILARF